MKTHLFRLLLALEQAAKQSNCHRENNDVFARFDLRLLDFNALNPNPANATQSNEPNDANTNNNVHLRGWDVLVLEVNAEKQQKIEKIEKNLKN